MTESTMAFGRSKVTILVENLDDGGRAVFEIPQSTYTEFAHEVEYDWLSDGWGSRVKSFPTNSTITLTLSPKPGKDYDFKVKVTQSLKQRYKTAEKSGKGLEFIKNLNEEDRAILLG